VLFVTVIWCEETVAFNPSPPELVKSQAIYYNITGCKKIKHFEFDPTNERLLNVEIAFAVYVH
jgi:hypothetical protein